MSGRKAKARHVQASDAVPSSSRTPTFQPPSYYAAAAGLQYSPKPASHQQVSDVHASTKNSANGVGTPLSYPTVDPDGQDSAEKGRDHSSSFSRSFSRALPKHQRVDKNVLPAQEKRRSQMAEIPFLETQLLPSLRDTIDRMTHPPRTGEDEAGGTAKSSESSRSRGDSLRGFRDTDSQERSIGLDARGRRSPLIFSPRSPAMPSQPRAQPTYEVPASLSPGILKTPKPSS